VPFVTQAPVAALCSVALLIAPGPRPQSTVPGQAPTGAPPTLSVEVQLKGQYAGIKRSLTRLADTMPADQYAFRPTPEVRTFAAGVAHTASTNFAMCANLTGQPNPMKGVDLEKTVLTKADSSKALADSFAFCDGYVTPLSPATGADTYQARSRTADGTEAPILVVRTGLLANLVEHGNEMYGYLSMYLRLKGLTPPTSASAGGRGGTPGGR
jgi:hypothetical protein